MAFHLERCGAGQDEDLGPLSGVLSRFMELYDDHAHHERELLHVLHARLDEAGRREVAKILAPLEGDR
jgi:UDP-N-acetylmuramate-alanine ligase